MKKIQNYFLFSFIFFIFYFLFAPEAQAVCPVCTIAVGAGVGLSRWLGIDDTVSGLWVGGLIISSALWFSSWFAKKNFKIPHQSFLSILLMFLLVVAPLQWGGIIGHKLNTLWGVDKLLLGIIIGSILFFLAVFVDKFLRYTNNHKVRFFYQKVVLPVSFLLAASVVFFFVTKK